MIIKQLSILAAGLMLFSACSKAPGQGGNSSITGNLRGFIGGSSGDDPRQEVTTVTFTEGALIDDNTYWLLNAPNGNLYYIWYDNTNWLGNDPALSGRTGIQVIYDFTQSNTTIATNTMTALQGATGSDFSYTINGDIITITAAENGNVADAEDMATPFAIDVLQQGKDGTSGDVGGEAPIADERVYLICGDEDFYSESVRTDSEGNYQFRGLRKGSYKVFAFSVDTTSSSGLLTQLEVSAEITKNKEVVQAPQLNIIK